MVPFFSLPLAVHARDFSAAAAEEQARRHNPELAAARWRIEEARARLVDAGRRPNPELLIEAGHTVDFHEGELMVGVMQKFPAAAKLSLEKYVSQALIEAAESETRVVERRLLVSVRQLVVQALVLDAQKDLRVKQLANAKELAGFAAARAGAGEGSVTEAVQFELEVHQLEIELLQIEAEKLGVLGELRPLLGLGDGNPIRLIGSLASPELPGGVPGADTRPEYQAAAQHERAAEQSLALEKARRRDDLSAGLFIGGGRSEDAPNGLGNDGLVGIRISIPLPLWNKNEGKIQQASATAARLRKEKESLAARLAAEAGTARSKMLVLARLVKEVDASLLPKSLELENQLQGFYVSGQAPLTDVLRARDKRLQLERTRLDALRDYHLAQASLGLGLN